MGEAAEPGCQFIIAIAQVVIARLLRPLESNQGWFEVVAADSYLRMTPVVLRCKVAGGEIPNVKLYAKLRFDKRDLDLYIDRAPREGV